MSKATQRPAKPGQPQTCLAKDLAQVRPAEILVHTKGDVWNSYVSSAIKSYETWQTCYIRVRVARAGGYIEEDIIVPPDYTITYRF